MRSLNRCFGFFNRISCDFRKIKTKSALIVSVIYFVLGLLIWIFGGSVHRVLLIYVFPKSAIPLGIMYILWGISFLICGFILGALLFNYDKYKKQYSYKISALLVIMQLFTFIAYPLFFGANSPFVSFLSYVIALIFCFFAISFSIKIYSLWSICLILHFVWLLYNAYIALAFSMIN